MDLRQFELDPQKVEYTPRVRRQFAISFLSRLKDQPGLSEEDWHDLISIGEQVYYTTFTDDSDYMPGAMDFSALDNQPSESRRELLDYFHSHGNWIVRLHVRDYRNKQGIKSNAVFERR